jgi:hypothetical protein
MPRKPKPDLTISILKAMSPDLSPERISYRLTAAHRRDPRGRSLALEGAAIRGELADAERLRGLHSVTASQAYEIGETIAEPLCLSVTFVQEVVTRVLGAGRTVRGE